MNQEIDLRALLKLIIKKKKVILGGTLIFVVLAGGIALLLPRIYEASLILEIGKNYLSPADWKEELQYLQEPEAAAELLKSAGILERVRKKLELEMDLETLGDRLEVNTFSEQNREMEILPILEIVCRAKTTGRAVDVLNSLAQLIIARHGPEYQAFRKGMENRIKHNREKIDSLKAIISAQKQYRELVQTYMDRDAESADEFIQGMDELDSSRPSPIDILYLQGSAMREKQHLTELTRLKAEMDIRISQNEKEVAGAQIAIVELQNRLDLSYPTRIISPAVSLPDPVEPRFTLILIIAALVGVTVMILAVFLREYLKD